MPHPIISEGPDYSAWDDASLDDDAATAAPPRRLTVGGAAAGERLDKWLAATLPEYSRSRLKQWIEAGHVRLNGVGVAARAPVFEGDEVTVAPQTPPEDETLVAEPVAFGTLYEDGAVLVIDKPAGLVVHPAAGNWTGTLAHGLVYKWPELAHLPRAGIVHRLDKDTSGLLVVARSLAAQTALVRQLKARTVAREYLAIVHGHPPPVGTIEAALGRHPRERMKMAVLDATASGAKPARTHFEVLATSTRGRQKTALVRCRLETGRTHQIRVHMQWAGFALVGDPLYGGRPGDGLGRQALHAARLGFEHPDSGAPVRFAGAPPADLEALAARLELGAALEKAARGA